MGITKNKDKFVAGIRINRKQIWLGCNFGSVEEACIARDRFIIDNNLEEYKTQILKKELKCQKW